MMNWYKKSQQNIPPDLLPLVEEAKKYRNAEEFKVSGFEAIEKLFFGFQTNDIISLSPNQIKIVEEADFQDATEGNRAVGITEQTPPVQVEFNINTGEFTLLDGHARYVAATRQGASLPVEVYQTKGNYNDMARIFLSKTGITVEEFFRQATQQEGIEDITKKWRKAGVTLYVFENTETIVLDTIIVPNKKEGLGTQIMNELTNYADKVRKRMELTTGQKDDRHGTTSKSRLIKFYKRFGFVENKGRNKDYTTMKNMYREPR